MKITNLFSKEKLLPANKGLSLLEVLVAFVVLGVTATLFYQAFVSAAWSGAGSKYRIEALNLARKQMEIYMSQDYDQVNNGSIIIPVATGSLANKNGNITCTIVSAPNNQDKKITVKVTWDEP